MEKKEIPILYEIKKYLETKGLDYFEIKFQRNKSRAINIENTSVKKLSESENQGVGIRILINKKLGFLSLNEYDNYKTKIDKLIENTKKINKKTEMENFSKIKDKDIIKYKDFEDKTNENKIKEIININKKYAKKEMDSIKILNSEILKNEVVIEKYFLTKDAEIYQKRPYSVFYNIMTGKKNNQIETSLSRIGELSGLEKVTIEDQEKLLFENKNTLKEILESKPCPAVNSDIILDPSVSDLLAHEAIGHSCEGDFLVDKTTVLRKGLKISNNKEVNVIDNPYLKNFGYFKYDDEGIKAQKTQLIKNGVVNDFMTNINVATKLKTKSNGSARSENYYSLPIVRMSNTYFQTGSTSEKDMFDKFNGYLLKGFSGGEVNPNVGTFMFGIKQAYKYKNGKIIEKYKQASISGDIKTYLNKITEVSKKQGEMGFGFCGKSGQTAFVGGTGPNLKIKNAVVGGTKHE